MIKKIIAVGGTILISLTVTSCDNQKEITIADFEKVGKIYTEEDETFNKSNIGESLEMAIVPFLTDKNGTMYKRNDLRVRVFFEEGKDKKNFDMYLTDLQTFAKVTGDPFATTGYVGCLGSGVGTEKGGCIYNYYRPNRSKED